jgi:hypothetical protein
MELLGSNDDALFTVDRYLNRIHLFLFPRHPAAWSFPENAAGV